MLLETESHDPSLYSDGGPESVPVSQRLPNKEIHRMTLPQPNTFSTRENVTVPHTLPPLPVSLHLKKRKKIRLGKNTYYIVEKNMKSCVIFEHFQQQFVLKI